MDKISLPPGKYVLDVTCGGRMMWFDKYHPNAVYTDIRTESHVLCDERDYNVSPDIECDFTDLPFHDKTFKLVVMDPPHLEKIGPTAFMAKKYGVLSMDWRFVIQKGMQECMRVLDDYGVLIFKWNEAQVKLNQVKPLFPCEPMFGHTTGKHGRTIWVTFMKIP